jgi:hypothetical protein
MITNVTVPSVLLEDIFRLLDYLEMRGSYDKSHFQKSGYSQRIENDNVFWELKLKIRQLQGHSMDTYLLSIDDITEDERQDLLEWVAAGNSVYDNPGLRYDESGCPMDFINACRADLEMTDNPSLFFEETSYDIDCGGGGHINDLPF